MPVTDDRLRPLISAEVFYPGQGDKQVADRGCVWLDVLAETAAFGTYSRDADGIPLLEYLQEVGLCCRGFVVDQDTRLAQYTVSGGAWEERYPATGYPLRYRLHQASVVADTVWSAAAKTHLVANADFCVEVRPLDAPSHNTLPAFVRVEWGTNGNAGWALLFREDVGNYLCRKVGPAYDVVAELPPLARGREGEFRVKVQHLADQLVISTGGERPLVYRLIGASVSSAAGPVVFRGRGMAAGFGLHQVRYYLGTRTSQRRKADRSRDLLAALTFAGVGTRYHQPAGTSVDLVDDSDPLSAELGYVATLTPVPAGSGVPFSFYRSPVLQAVQAEYPVVLDPLTGLGFSERPWDGLIRRASVQKELALDESTADLTIRKDPGEQLTGNFDRRKVVLRLGHANTDGSSEWAGVFVGYTRDPRCRHSHYNESEFTVILDNPAIRWKETAWDEYTRRPLGGLTPNQALTLIVGLQGVDASGYSWHPLGDMIALDPGTPEEPGEYPPRGESFWETMSRIAGYVGLEFGVLDDGTLVTGLPGFAQPYLAGTLEMVPEENLTDLIQDISLTQRTSERATAVFVHSRNAWGEAISAHAIDTQAEQNTFSPRYRPWRVSIQEEVQGPTTPGLLALRAQALAAEYFSPRFEAEVQIPVRLGFSRRDQVQVRGTTVGIADTDRWVILTLSHDYDAEPGFGQCSTTVGLRRLT